MTPVSALEHACHGLGLKPRDPSKIIATLEKDYQVKVDGQGVFTQGGVLANHASIIVAYAEKHPLDFHGMAGEVRFKSDLPDVSARVAYINKFGRDAWDRLPVNDKSPGAANVVNAVIPSESMKASEYAKLSRSEKAKLCGQIGAAGIEKILARR